ncbi:Qat anti-phage system QueC-like protein QatC [Hyphomonas oceanitis]|uniref:Qat anti-phage system QueC-like protein QatC n=1 Tax=Hyphomonas oceanitis TaxID=81033 RepID=UPI0030036941|tara:strand:+ start:3003 stop:4322 length:1320 start_codon:yes stop_codon:yes gene_type:complete
MTTVRCDPDIRVLIGSQADRKIVLFDNIDNTNGIASIGNRVREVLRHINLPIPVEAFDFLTIALSVTAADEFVSRDDGAYGFVRSISLSIALAKPAVWKTQTHALESILRFLTGDDWSLSFTANGLTPPTKSEKKRLVRMIDLSNIEQVCLFSGGLDSLIGAVNQLKARPNETLLVSRASTGDQKFQNHLLGRLGSPSHLSINDRPIKPNGVNWDKEGSTRSRSILFLALAACCASAVSLHRSGLTTPILIPENGLIALNPPLTPRRRGSLSTRTAHPHYLQSLQKIFDDVGLGVSIRNPYEFMTKGEMIKDCADQKLIHNLAPNTISCGKWKRRNQQCGKCVPCLIRRASMFAANIPEPVGKYEYGDLSTLTFGAKQSVDLAAVRLAIRCTSEDSVPRWVSASGPLPTDELTREKYYQVAWRGLKELQIYLTTQGIKV